LGAGSCFTCYFGGVTNGLLMHAIVVWPTESAGGAFMAEQRENSTLNGIEESRREFMKAAGRFAVYTPPALLVLMKPSREAIAASGAYGCNNGVGNGPDCLPPGLEKNGKGGILDNDDNGGTPGNPQNRGGNH
jgi:hypothetical protein